MAVRKAAVRYCEWYFCKKPYLVSSTVSSTKNKNCTPYRDDAITKGYGRDRKKTFSLGISFSLE